MRPRQDREAPSEAAITSFERELSHRGYHAVCGVDEVGRGALAGPVVAAAVILPDGFFMPGVRDSKRLTPLARESLFGPLVQQALSFGIGRVECDLIDQINIRQATLLAMKQAVEQLKIRPDYLLVDALTIPGVQIEQRAIIHGDDRSISIAAASIIAKVIRDRLMSAYHLQFPAYQFPLHKGYGTAQHLSVLKEKGPCPIHRKTFRGVMN